VCGASVLGVTNLQSEKRKHLYQQYSPQLRIRSRACSSSVRFPSAQTRRVDQRRDASRAVPTAVMVIAYPRRILHSTCTVVVFLDPAVGQTSTAVLHGEVISVSALRTRGARRAVSNCIVSIASARGWSRCAEVSGSRAVSDRLPAAAARCCCSLLLLAAAALPAAALAAAPSCLCEPVCCSTARGGLCRRSRRQAGSQARRQCRHAASRAPCRRCPYLVSR
jgi:hypothetical protein